MVARGQGHQARVSEGGVWAHWDKLIAGDKLPNILIDWTSWIDETEENELRNNPYGHDAHAMLGAMGGNWGSNVDRTARARKQAQAVNTSSHDPDDEDEITMG